MKSKDGVTRVPLRGPKVLAAFIPGSLQKERCYRMKRLVCLAVATLLTISSPIVVGSPESAPEPVDMKWYTFSDKQTLGNFFESTIVVAKAVSHLVLKSGNVPTEGLAYFDKKDGNKLTFLVALRHDGQGRVRVYFVARNGENLFLYGQRIVTPNDGPDVSGLLFSNFGNPDFRQLAKLTNPVFEPSSSYGAMFLAWLKLRNVASYESCIPNFGWSKTGYFVLWFECGGGKRLTSFSPPR
jgi:hypothetical protein